MILHKVKKGTSWTFMDPEKTSFCKSWCIKMDPKLMKNHGPTNLMYHSGPFESTILHVYGKNSCRIMDRLVLFLCVGPGKYICSFEYSTCVESWTRDNHGPMILTLRTRFLFFMGPWFYMSTLLHWISCTIMDPVNIIFCSIGHDFLFLWVHDSTWDFSKWRKKNSCTIVDHCSWSMKVHKVWNLVKNSGRVHDSTWVPKFWL